MTDTDPTRGDAFAAMLAPLMDLLSPRSAIDVGCCRGDALWLFIKRSCLVVGFDIRCDEIEDSDLWPFLRCVDITITTPPEILKTFDLTISTEVAEHIPARSEPAFLQWITQTPWLFFSANDGGAYVSGESKWKPVPCRHVNCQPREYWVERLRGCGYDERPDMLAKWAEGADVWKATQHIAQRAIIFGRDTDPQ